MDGPRSCKAAEAIWAHPIWAHPITWGVYPLETEDSTAMRATNATRTTASDERTNDSMIGHTLRGIAEKKVDPLGVALL
jgi:hypothetical protein